MEERRECQDCVFYNYYHEVCEYFAEPRLPSEDSCNQFA